MPKVENTRDGMIANMRPALDDTIYCFLNAPTGTGAAQGFENPFAMIQEAEGTTFIVPAGQAAANGDALPPFARITLQVHSALEGVGLTAAVAAALADADIPCNMIAGYHHDHVFVPASMAQRALDILHTLSRSASA